MSNHVLDALVHTARPVDIDGVLDRMRAIERALPAEHGVAWFNRLYRWTTESVQHAVNAQAFEDPDAIVALDVRFANLYFDAIDAWTTESPAPPAWRPLLRHAADPGVVPLRFALAGMHAHIDRDLAVAVATMEGQAPEEHSPRYRDYLRINEVLDRTSDAVRGRLLPPSLAVWDDRLGELDDRLVVGAITLARRAAWEAAQLLWRVRDVPWAWEAAVVVLDRSVESSAEALLHRSGRVDRPRHAEALRAHLADGA